MRRIGIVRGLFSRFSLVHYGRWVLAALSLLVNAASAIAAEQIPVFPTRAYDTYIIYQSVIIFWLAILCLIVVIHMKLKEIERTQELGADREDENAPLLQ